ncbi:DUF3094 family protein [Sinobacterium caligoides]|nr:DUF3094 family protein [Sinobacterium caligoides]
MEDNKLSAGDKRRVEVYLSSGFNRTQRKPFRPWRLLAVLLIVMTGLSVASIVIARWSGVF